MPFIVSFNDPSSLHPKVKQTKKKKKKQKQH